LKRVPFILGHPVIINSDQEDFCVVQAASEKSDKKILVSKIVAEKKTKNKQKSDFRKNEKK
jgi:hypothetical protein